MLKRKWSKEAEDNLDSILEYLLTQWTEREAARFLSKLDRVVALIEKRPHLYPRSKRNVHKAVVIKQVTLYYAIKGKTVYLLQLFNNKQHPKKRKG